MLAVVGLSHRFSYARESKSSSMANLISPPARLPSPVKTSSSLLSRSENVATTFVSE